MFLISDFVQSKQECRQDICRRLRPDGHAAKQSDVSSPEDALHARQGWSKRRSQCDDLPALFDTP